MHVIYRISQNGYPKDKPEYINNLNCFNNAFDIFDKEDWRIIADSVDQETKSFLQNKTQNIKFVSIGHGAGTFNLALDYALTLPSSEVVYFLEDDYLHLPSSQEIVEEAVLDMGFDYVTLYDHPDKYLNPFEGGNPYCNGRAEDTRVYLGEYCHYKLTNSTTMTFASRVGTLIQDEDILRKWTKEEHPHDFEMFLELKQTGKRLASTLPAFSTHGESKWLSPLRKWNELV
jgi:hypothetical protein